MSFTARVAVRNANGAPLATIASLSEKKTKASHDVHDRCVIEINKDAAASSHMRELLVSATLLADLLLNSE